MTVSTDERSKTNSKEHAAERAERSERLAREAARLADPGARVAYASRFRRRLLEEVGSPGSPISRDVLALAHSRAALATWSGSGLHPKDGEEVRLQVLADERDSLGVEAMRGGEEVTDSGRERDEEALRVPRGRALPDARVRRGGRR